MFVAIPLLKENPDLVLNGIQEIADKYGLKVIYDAAHAFGVEVDGRSILEAGDLSTLSFHATKVYNTVEGGALICHDEKTKKRIVQAIIEDIPLNTSLSFLQKIDMLILNDSEGLIQFDGRDSMTGGLTFAPYWSSYPHAG